MASFSPYYKNKKIIKNNSQVWVVQIDPYNKANNADKKPLLEWGEAACNFYKFYLAETHTLWNKTCLPITVHEIQPANRQTDGQADRGGLVTRFRKHPLNTEPKQDFYQHTYLLTMANKYWVLVYQHPILQA